jgi:hypothetical protein
MEKESKVTVRFVSFADPTSKDTFKISIAEVTGIILSIHNEFDNLSIAKETIENFIQ